MSNPPQVSLWLDVPEDCYIKGEFTGDLDIQFTLGYSGHAQNLLFERDALERFVKLASELLAAPLPDGIKADFAGIGCPVMNTPLFVIRVTYKLPGWWRQDSGAGRAVWP